MTTYLVFVPDTPVTLEADTVVERLSLSTLDPSRVEFWKDNKKVGSFVLNNIGGWKEIVQKSDSAIDLHLQVFKVLAFASIPNQARLWLSGILSRSSRLHQGNHDQADPK